VEHFRAMRHVFAEAHDHLAALDRPAFVGQFACQLGAGWVSGVRVLEHSPGLEVLTERNAGMIILFSLCFAGRADGPFPPVDPVPLSINALATNFSVSRKHVLTLIRDSEAAGLLSRGGAANNEVTILPRAREGLEAFFAAMFLYEAQCAERALRCIGDAAAPVDAGFELA
jgi:hypothetical protein